MESVAVGLAAISVITAIGLAFAVAELHKMVRQLQDGIRALAQRTSATSIPIPRSHENLKSSDGTRTIYLVTSPDCSVCAERITQLAPLIRDGPDRFIVVAARPYSDESGLSGLDVLCDTALVGQLEIQATPVIVVISGEGQETYRRVIADPTAMEQATAWLKSTTNESNVVPKIGARNGRP